MDDYEIRPSTEKDVKDFFPDLGHTVRAWSVFHKNELVCVAGIAFTGVVMLAFCQIKSDFKAPKMTIWRHALIIWEKMKALGYPMLYAVADPFLWTAPEFLKRLGFRHVESSARGEVFVWATQ